MLRDKGTRQEKIPHVETKIKSEAVLPSEDPGTRGIRFGAIGQKCGMWLNLEEFLIYFKASFLKDRLG